MYELSVSYVQIRHMIWKDICKDERPQSDNNTPSDGVVYHAKLYGKKRVG